jgi:hypothetical protein
MVIVAIRYMILALERFNSTDTRGIEELMYQVQREVVNEMMDCAIILIIDTLLDSIRECFGVSESRIGELVNLFISKLPDVWRRRFKVTQTGEN